LPDIRSKVKMITTEAATDPKLVLTSLPEGVKALQCRTTTIIGVWLNLTHNKYTSRKERKQHPISCKVGPKPNIPLKEVASICPNRSRLLAQSDPNRPLRFEQYTSLRHKRIQRTFKGTRAIARIARDTSHSAISLPDYTEKERQVWCTDTDTGILPGITRKCNMRSKFRWLTEFCNSHYVSQFAAFFIDVRA
jgi:hypothetical protein